MGNGAKAVGGAVSDFGKSSGISGGVGQAAGFLDPLDVFGQKQKARDADTEKMIANQSAQMDQFMATRPEYASMQNSFGGLDSKYKLQGPEDATAYTTSTKDLDKRMGAAKEVGVNDVAYTGDVNAGANFKSAQGNIDALQKRAFGTETSPWAKKLYDQQAMQQQDQLGQVGFEQRNAFNQATNDMAMQGGLEGGSRERLARGSARDSMMARQGVFRQGQSDKLGIGINDEAQRMQLQTAMPGMNMQMDQYNTGLQQQNRDVKNQLAINNQGVNLNEQQFNAGLNMQKANQWATVDQNNNAQKTGVSQFNAGQQNQVNAINQATLIGDVKGQNAYALDTWNTQGSVLGNSQAANAQARQGSGSGGFFNKLLGV